MDSSHPVLQLKNVFRPIYIFELFVGLSTSIYTTLWYYRQARAKGGLRTVAAYTMHIFNLCIALIGSNLFMMMEMVGREMDLFDLNVVQAAGDPTNVGKILYVVIDFGNTFTLTYSIASVAFLCIQR